MDDIFRGIDLLRIAGQFDETAVRVEFIRELHNYAYKVICPDNSFILRITSERHRSINQISSELDFQLYLYKNGAAVVSPLLTVDNKSVLFVTVDNQAFYIAAFSWANGQNWDGRSSDSTPEKLKNIGKELGKIHRLARDYKPERAEKRRLWNESQHLIKAYELFRAYDEKLYSAFVEYMNEMSDLPIDSDVFGLTHGDYQLSNYMIDENGHITVFDFDECEYSWYATDIAIWVHCFLLSDDPTKLITKAEDAEMMLYYLIAGYITENKLNRDVIMNLQPLFTMRDFVYLSTILENKSKGAHNKWGDDFISTCLDRILNKKPFLEFDISKTLSLL